ncbi:MAG: hypothetical protein IJ120_02175 [Solobacterium sp.]|nr:hypothetical protein [Solobacterium sp.]
MNRKVIRTVCTAAVIVIALYFMPFITVKTTDSTGRTWRVPFGVSFRADENNTLTFSSIRSAYALGKDADNAFHSYEESKCYGRTYYYDADNDVSLVSHEESGILPTRLRYVYEEGNACAGWTLDDEIAWPLGEITEVNWQMTPAEATEKGWITVDGEKALNMPAYNDFSRLMKQGVYSAQRVMLYSGENLQKIIDIQLLESGRFRIVQRTGDQVTEEIYARLSDQEDENGVKEVCVYNGSFKEEVPILLFRIGK